MASLKSARLRNLILVELTGMLFAPEGRWVHMV